MRGYGLAFSSSLLLILAFPPFHLLFLPFVALVPLAVSLGSLSPGPGSGRKAALLGLSFGALHWGLLLCWVPLVVAPQFPWAFPGYGVQVALLSGLAAGLSWTTHRLRIGSGIPLFVGFPLAWVSMEWLKAHFPLGLAFPWLGLGVSLSSWPELLSLAEWTGEAGVALWVAVVNGLLAAGVLALGRGKGVRGAHVGPRALFCAGIATVLLPGALSFGRTRSLALEEGPTVAVVGTNVSRNLRRLPARASEEGLRQARGILGGVSIGQTDLVVLPEAIISLPLDEPAAGTFRSTLQEMVSEIGAPILFGALGSGSGLESSRSEPDPARPKDNRATNSAFLMNPDGSLVARYDKIRLVPGMEWGYSAGSGAGVLRVGRLGVGPLICYESLFSDLARAQVRAGAEVLVNLSSDVWFGTGTRGLAAIFLHQHAAHLVMRAVETRSAVARAGNGGFSLLLDPTGTRLSPAVPPTGGLVMGTLSTFPATTLYTLTGDWVGPGALVAVLFLLLRGWLKEDRGFVAEGD